MIILSVLLIAVMIYIEYSQYNLIATPTTVMGGIYMLLMVMVNTFGQSLGFLRVSDKTIMLNTFFLFVMWVSGWVFGVYYKRNRGLDHKLNFIGEKLLANQKGIWKIFLVSLACYVISLLQVISRYGINGTKSRAFGVFAHIGLISRCLLPVIIYYFIKTKKNQYLIGTLVNIVALIIFRGKYHLYIPIAGFIMLLLIQRKNIALSKLIKYVVSAFLSGLVLFINVYTIIPNLLTGERYWSAYSRGIEYSTRHFFHYLFCPMISSNTYFDNPVYTTVSEGIKVNFNPLQRILAFFGSENYYSPVISLYPIIDKFGSKGNVGGLFSESVLNIGYLLAVCYVFLVSGITYYFISKCLIKGKRIITSLCFAGTLMMSFFCNYFSLLPNFECFVYSYLIDVLLLDTKLTFGRVSLTKGA